MGREKRPIASLIPVGENIVALNERDDVAGELLRTPYSGQGNIVYCALLNTSPAPTPLSSAEPLSVVTRAIGSLIGVCAVADERDASIGPQLGNFYGWHGPGGPP